MAFRVHSDERGAAALEFALVLPMLIMLVMGIAEFSRAYHAKEKLQYAVREGARELAINKTSATAISVTVDRAGGLNPALTSAGVTASGCTGAITATSTATVTATYTLAYHIPLWGSGNWSLSATGVMRCNG